MSKTIAEWIEEISAWQNQTFTEATPVSAAIHLTREALEVQQSAKSGLEGLDLELADVFLLTVAVAQLSGIDLEAAIGRKMFHNRNRSWGKPDAEGVVEHVRELPVDHIEELPDGSVVMRGDVLILRSSAANGGKIFNSPNTID